MDIIRNHNDFVNPHAPTGAAMVLLNAGNLPGSGKMADAPKDRNKMASRDLPATPHGLRQPVDNQRDLTIPAEDDHFDERQINRPEYKRGSSGIVSDVTSDSLEYPEDYRKWSGDSGNSSPFVQKTFFEKGAALPGKDVQDVRKEMTNELVSNERFARLARSHSQGEIQVKKSFDKNEREKKSKKSGQTFTDKTSDPRQVLPPLTRAKTLPHGRTHPKGKSTGRSIKKRFNNLTRSFRRSPKERPTTKENNSDSESYGRRKIQPSPLLNRRSRSMENLLDIDDGYDQVRFPDLPRELPKSADFVLDGGEEYESFNYDIPQEVSPAGNDVHLSAKNNRWSQEDEAYESVEHVDGLPIASEDERRYSRFEPGSIQVDGSDGGRFPSATVSTKPPMTKSTVDGKPIPSPRQSVRQKQLPPPQPPPAKEPILPAPSAEENCKMAHQAIQNVINENPKARKTEIVIQTLNFVAKFCDAHGGYLEVGSKKATLFIPPFALDCDTLIYVQIEESYCLFGEQGHQIAPVVHCGKSGTQFNTPVILTFYTSIQDTRYFNVTGLRKQTPKAERNDNEGKIATKGVRKETVQSANEDPADWHETTEKEGKVMSVENGKCTVMLYHFTNDSLLATPKETERHFAKIGVIAFTSPVMKKGNIFDIRVWMSSKQEVLKEDERREMKDNQAKPLYHFCPTLCLFEDGGDVTVEITNLERKWSIRDPNSSPQQQSVKLPKLKYTHDHVDQGIRESLVFRIHPSEQFVPRETVSFDIELYQPKRKDFGIRIPVCVEPEPEPIPDAGATNAHGQNQQFRVVRQSTPWIPTKESLGRLDQSLSRNDNWKPLAAWLHLDVCELEIFHNPATMMLSMVFQKHAVNGGEHIRKALEELDNALSTGKLGAGLREAGDIVREILGKEPAAQPADSVAIRQPTEEVWPVSMSPIEVNEYQFKYHTLQSDPYASANVLGAIQPVQVDFNSNTDHRGATGGPPRTLVSNPHSPRLVKSVPTQEEWPPQNNNVAQGAEGHSIQDNPTELVPRGPNEEVRRKSSGYCTIPVINPNRPPMKTPDTSELHYDQPYIRQTGPAQANALANHLDDSSYDKVGAVALVPSVTSSNSDGLLGVDMSEGRRLSDVIREEHQDPPYQNLLTGTKPKEKGYLKSIHNSKVYHK